MNKIHLIKHCILLYAKAMPRKENLVSHVGLLLLEYRGSNAMHYVKNFLKWYISLLGNTAELKVVALSKSTWTQI